MREGWRHVRRNRRFLVFAAGYSAFLLSSRQLDLALPVELDRSGVGTAALGWLLVLASVLVVLGQLPLVGYARARLGAARAFGAGFALMAAGFAVVAGCALRMPAVLPAVAPATALVVLITAGQMLVAPVAADVVARLVGEQRLGAYFGALSTAGGLAVLVGSTAGGALLTGAETPHSAAALPWVLLVVVPATAGVALWRLTRRLPAARPPTPDRSGGVNG